MSETSFAIDIDEGHQDHKLAAALKEAVTDAISQMGIETFKQSSMFLSSAYHKPGGRGHAVAQRLERCRARKRNADVAQG